MKCEIRGDDDDDDVDDDGDGDAARVKVTFAIKPARRSERKYVHADVRLHMSAIFSILHITATISTGSRCILYSRLCVGVSVCWYVGMLVVVV